MILVFLRNFRGGQKHYITVEDEEEMYKVLSTLRGAGEPIELVQKWEL